MFDLQEFHEKHESFMAISSKQQLYSKCQKVKFIACIEYCISFTTTPFFSSYFKVIVNRSKFYLARKNPKYPSIYIIAHRRDLLEIL